MKDIRKLIQYAQTKSKTLLLFLALGACLEAMGNLLLIIAPKLILKYLDEKQEIATVLVVISTIFVIYFLVRSVSHFFSGKRRVKAEQLFHGAYQDIVTKDIRIPYFETLKKDKIDLLEQSKYGIWEIPGAFEGLSQLGAYAVSGVVAAFIIVTYEWKLILVPLFINLVLFFIYKKIREIDVDNSKRLISENRSFGWYCRLINDFKFGKDIRLYSAQNLIMKQCRLLMDKIYKVNQQAFSKKGMLLGFSKFLLQLQIVGIVIVLGIQYANQKVDAGDFLLLFGAICGFSRSLNGVQELESRLKRLCLLLHPFFEFMDCKEEIQLQEQNKEPLIKDIERFATDDSCIRFEKVSFSYPGLEKVVLKDVDLTIRKGERIGLVGTNGAGKTTLVRLLCGFYEPTSGRITFDNQDIRSIDMQTYRKMLSVVFQNYTMLPIRINEIISSIVEEEIKANETACMKDAIKSKSLLKWLEALPEGERTFLGPDMSEQYTNPSGGQKQNIAISRALYKKATINILDEPTSSLDIYEEISAMEQFNENSRNQITILISHRLSQVKLVDRVIVMDQGRIVEEGTHKELLNNRGLYQKMYRLQAEKYGM